MISNYNSPKNLLTTITTKNINIGRQLHLIYSYGWKLSLPKRDKCISLQTRDEEQHIFSSSLSFNFCCRESYLKFLMKALGLLSYSHGHIDKK